jgi:hypothetical protein
MDGMGIGTDLIDQSLNARTPPHPFKQTMKGLGKGKKKPLGLPSTLQQELGLGLGGSGGGKGAQPFKAKKKKKKMGAAPLSRKEVSTCVNRSIHGLRDRSID